MEKVLNEIYCELKKLKPQTDIALLSPGQVLKELGIKSNDRAWHGIRKILIEQYGMTRLPGVGYRIPRRNLEKFLSENYV